jgi:hypothetical protein
MREYVIACCVGLAACGGANAKRDSAPRDTSAIPGPPAVGATQAPESMVSHLRPAPAVGGGADTVRGIVSVVGTDRFHQVTVARPGGGKHIGVTGPLAALVGHVAGADVWVAGTMTGTAIEATRFIVRTVDGASAIDGTLKTEGAILYIITADGSRKRIVTPPPPLVGREGARVWITGDPARAVEAYGFIDPPR